MGFLINEAIDSKRLSTEVWLAPTGSYANVRNVRLEHADSSHHPTDDKPRDVSDWQLLFELKFYQTPQSQEAYRAEEGRVWLTEAQLAEPIHDLAYAKALTMLQTLVVDPANIVAT